MEIRKLNLVMTYPVKWGLYEVMSNFVQNFYDAVGSEKFMEHFQYEYTGSEIILRSDVGFSKEWLFYMGASSKRDGAKKYAGRFGEGFKIASLVAYRDFGLGIRMESRDWKLTVTEKESQIDGKDVHVLAYEIEDRDFDESTKLIIGNATEEHFKELVRQIDCYYYEGNTKFGACIANGDDFAVYEAAPRPDARWDKGYVFVNFRLRDYLELPLVVCNHDYQIKGDDRDRLMLDVGESNEIIRDVFRRLDARSSFRVLEISRPRWKNTYDRKGDRRNWYSLLKILIQKVSEYPETKKLFLDKYGDLLITKGFNLWMSDFRKKMAIEWFRNSEYHDTKKVVCGLFCYFDLPTMEGLCEENHGFDEDAAPSVIQQQYIEILKEVADAYFRDLYCYKKLPDCRILLNKEAPIAGKAKSVRETDVLVSKMGLRVITHMRTVYIQADILQPERFGEALVVYLHELLHQYGGDGSAQFKKALVFMNEILVEHLEEIKKYEENWRKVEGYVTDQTGNSQ